MYSQQIKTFIQVADRGSLSKAAEDLFVTPASIMKQMNALEGRLGVTLLKRTNQGIEVTEAGKYIYKAAKKIIAESEDAVLKAKAIEQSEIKTIRVGSSFLNPSNVLINLWNTIRPECTEYRIKIVPYNDDHEHILSVVASLGSTMDFMVGVFGSQQMLSMSKFYELGRYHLCVAVPGNHRFASKTKLSLNDLHGEHLVVVKSGDALHLDKLREILKMTHPQIILEDAPYFYDLETFNACEVTGSLLLTLDAWADIHPSLVTLPVEWDYTVPYGLLYSPELSDEAAAFLKIIEQAIS
ncbi:LysR family transcriptional regulator [Enterocloster bolteae]|uniref:LysR family transcriptional regulator n=1 Tax=Enterocloster bolteae TaxID=208479 RepID=UPI002A8184BC|nr:LysR family transcriptional regulator [Enterocloster bolteae]